MKRSDAILEIYAYLKQHSIYQISGEQILKLVEDLGMAPPKIEKESWKIKENGEMTYDVRRWETE